MLDLLTPKEALQGVIVGGILAGYHALGRIYSAWSAKKKAFALKEDLDKFKQDIVERIDNLDKKFEKFMRLRACEQDKVCDIMEVPMGTLKVLLIEDDRNDRVIMHRAAPGIQFDDAPTLEDGLRMLERNGYDCVILDIGLPGQKELESLREVRKKDANKPIVIWTGNSNPRFPMEAAALGVDGWLFKNVKMNGDDVVRAIKQAILRRAAEITTTI